MTKQYGILAFPAKHSLSPVIHNAGFKGIGMDAQYRIYEIPENEFAGFMERAKLEPISGLSVSLPYKQDVMQFMTKIDEDSENIGAVNTVVNKGGFLYGYNTDALGSNKALEEVIGDPSGKTVVVIGAGGAARAVVYGLLKENANVWIMNRTKLKADRIAMDFAENFESEVHSGDLSELWRGDILINASSIWTRQDFDENNLPDFCREEYLRTFDVVMDIAYEPLITPLLKAAENAGCRIITGEKMLLYQAYEQFNLWTGQEAPQEIMREALEKSLGV